MKIIYSDTEDWSFLKHRQLLAKAAMARGVEVHAATAPGAHVESLIREGFVFHPVRFQRSGLNPFRDLITVLDLYRLYRKIRPDVVHHVTLKPICYGTIAARLAGVPAVVNAVTGLGYVFIGEETKRRVLRMIGHILFRVSLWGQQVRTVFQNPDDRSYFVSHGLVKPSSSTVIRGAGIDLCRFLPAPEPAGTPVVLVATRLLWDKGIGELVEAARIVKGRRIEVRIQLAGKTDPANPACIPAQVIQQWTQEGLIEWLGYREDMPGLHAASHVTCLPSYREGLPLALLEGAATGRSVVTTDVPGCREAVVHGETGLLVPPRDPVALADALATLASDADLRRRMGQAGRRLVEERFAIERVARETFAVYESLLGRPVGSVVKN